MMDISSPHLTFFWCSQLRGRLDDICINRAATEHNFPAWYSQRIHFRLINSRERRAFKSAYLFWHGTVFTATWQVVAFCREKETPSDSIVTMFYHSQKEILPKYRIGGQFFFCFFLHFATSELLKYTHIGSFSMWKKCGKPCFWRKKLLKHRII